MDKIFDAFAHIHASGRDGRVSINLGDDLKLTSPAPGSPALFLDRGRTSLATLRRSGSHTWRPALCSAPAPFKADVWELIKALRDDPIAALAARGKRLGFCCLCGRPLSNEESVALGMGPICRGRLE